MLVQLLPGARSVASPPSLAPHSIHVLAPSHTGPMIHGSCLSIRVLATSLLATLTPTWAMAPRSLLPGPPDRPRTTALLVRDHGPVLSNPTTVLTLLQCTEQTVSSLSAIDN
jgi:hypothetical protein